ncbi:MAG TPA: hypothetical protein VFL12_09265 [Thermoanaerobaculia bacterium]|nr:hypothetical protein [Thermoanaerobaculia bacterium]
MVLSALLLAALVRAGDAPKTALEAGRWGGEHAVVDVSESGATVQLDCAHGSISAAIALDGDGSFDLEGTLVKEHGGPIRKNEAEDRRRARYRGRVQGGTMTLTIESLDGGEPSGPFTLERGSDGHVVRCR